jgi:putative phosphoribosyl transferase
LPLVGAPSLLIVGEKDVGEKDDKKIIRINKHVLKKIGSKEKRSVLIPGATHLFEEAGTLEQVGKLSSDWFRRYLPI